MVIQVPAGVAILYPSALLLHFNVDVPGESLCYTVGFVNDVFQNGCFVSWLSLKMANGRPKTILPLWRTQTKLTGRVAAWSGSRRELSCKTRI